MIYADMILTLIELVLAIILLLLVGYSEKNKNAKLRLMYVAPIVPIIAIIAVAGPDKYMIPVYVAGCVLTTGLFTDKAKYRRYASIFAILMVFLTSSLTDNSDYRPANYSKDFDEMFDTFRAHYVLSDHKEIDWDELYNKYKPEFDQATKDNNETANMIAWNKFVNEFHDGHVSYMSKNIKNDEDFAAIYGEEAFGNDYGLSLMRYESGEFVAVNVDPGLANLGITEGTVILSWDGKSPEEYYSELDNFATTVSGSFEDKETEEFYAPIFVAGIGGDSVAVTFIDEGGNTVTQNLSPMGKYYNRLVATKKILNKSVEITNLDWQSVDDSTALIRISAMGYDAKTYAGTDYTEMTEELRPRILEEKVKGTETLVMDLRSNTGGSPYMTMAIAGLIAPEGEHVLSYSGVLNDKTAEYEKDAATGKYKIGNKLTYQGENLWGHGNVIVLVDDQTVSAGDMLVYTIKDYPNVTVLGFTKSYSAGQAVTGIEGSYGILSFSAIPSMDENGNIILDSGADRVAQNEIDVKVPFDEEAMSALFIEGRDYLLDYALGRE